MSQVNVVVPDEHANLVRRVGNALRPRVSPIRCADFSTMMASFRSTCAKTSLRR